MRAKAERMRLWLRPWIGLVPLGLPFVALFGAGLVMTMAQSVGLFSPVPLSEPWYAGYARLASSWFAATLGFSLYVALASAGASVILGTVLAYLIWRLPERVRPLAVVYKIPLVLPHLAVAFIVLILFSQSGFLASLGHAVGLVDQPADFPAVLFAGNGLGLIMAYTLKGVPFTILLVLAVLARLDRRLPVTAAMLGASPARVFLRVVLPHVAPAANTAFIILFLYAFGAFDIPYLLSESSPGMLSISAFNLYFQRDLANRPTALAMLVVVFLVSAVCIWLYARVVARLASGERKL